MTIVRKALARLRRMDYTPLLLCWATAVFYAFLCLFLGVSPVGPTKYPTYTLQALAWRGGQLCLEHDYPSLELAIYEGRFFVSFPPVPSVPLYLLSFAFGMNTPDNLLVKLYVLVGCLAVYRMLRRAGYEKPAAAGFALLCSFAGCLLTLTTEGAVWYQAQTLAFCLTCLAAALTLAGHPTPSLLCYALAVGCRPFNALYGPLLYALFLQRSRKEGLPFRRVLLRLLPGTLLGLGVACAYGWYNGVRFGNIFEFGHNYLPEFSFQGGVQFSLSHVMDNVRTFLLGLPFHNGWEGWALTKFGFSFLLASPVFALLLVWCACDLIRRRFTWVKALLMGAFLAHLFLLLLHRTFGGYQFGARYTCDLLPYAALYLAQEGHARRMRAAEIAVLIAALAFSVYGAVEVLV